MASRTEAPGRAPGRRGAPARAPANLRRAERCRRKFLRHFPGGFHGEKYVDWERDYKWQAHLHWRRSLGPQPFRQLLEDDAHGEIAQRAVRIEAKTNLLFSFEKMALRDALKEPEGARAFARGLYDLLHGGKLTPARYERWVATVRDLPRRQTRVLTWPVLTVFPFLAQPRRHLYVKPMVTKTAAAKYGYDLAYRSTPDFETYDDVLGFARTIEADVADLGPRDRIDVQSFIWVQGSEEYP